MPFLFGVAQNPFQLLVKEDIEHIEETRCGGDPFVDQEQLVETVELSRATEAEKQSQLKRLSDFKKRHADEAPSALQRLQKVALSGENIFAELMDTVRVCSLGQITQALYEVGGQYRRNM